MKTRKLLSKTVPKKKDKGFNLDEALASMAAEELRELARDMFSELGPKAHYRVVNTLMKKAARTAKGSCSSFLSGEKMAEIEMFAERAIQRGDAYPEDIDEYLQEGSTAFLRRDYRGAAHIFKNILLPIAEGDIYLGQDELISEVLAVEISACAAQYVTAIYMITEKEKRAKAFKETMLALYYEGHFWQPLEELEQTAIEPLPDFESFLGNWRHLLEKDIREGRRYQNDEQNRWLREVVRRLEGAGGLAKVARASKRAEDLRGWCQTLVSSGDWKSALSAYREAAEVVDDRDYVRADFLDGVALSAQQLGRKNISEHLEAAWRECPTLLRLNRWLGASNSSATVKKRARLALEACATGAHRQKALLHLILSDFSAAAKLLRKAKGLGWSDVHHPGHLVFPVFYKLLGGKDVVFANGYTTISTGELAVTEMEIYAPEYDKPSLANPSIQDIFAIAQIGDLAPRAFRKTMLSAMKKSAKNRTDGVTGNGRRRYYSHAAQLVAACLAVDSTPDTVTWVSRLRTEYRRYPALQAAFAEVL